MNKIWTKFQYVAVTSVIPAGISYDEIDHFYRIYLSIDATSENGPNAAALQQLNGRVRHVISNCRVISFVQTMKKQYGEADMKRFEPNMKRKPRYQLKEELDAMQETLMVNSSLSYTSKHDAVATFNNDGERTFEIPASDPMHPDLARILAAGKLQRQEFQDNPLSVFLQEGDDLIRTYTTSLISIPNETRRLELLKNTHAQDLLDSLDIFKANVPYQAKDLDILLFDSERDAKPDEDTHEIIARDSVGNLTTRIVAAVDWQKVEKYICEKWTGLEVERSLVVFEGLEMKKPACRQSLPDDATNEDKIIYNIMGNLKFVREIMDFLLVVSLNISELVEYFEKTKLELIPNTNYTMGGNSNFLSVSRSEARINLLLILYFLGGFLEIEDAFNLEIIQLQTAQGGTLSLPVFISKLTEMIEKCYDDQVSFILAFFMPRKRYNEVEGMKYTCSRHEETRNLFEGWKRFPFSCCLAKARYFKNTDLFHRVIYQIQHGEPSLTSGHTEWERLNTGVPTLEFKRKIFSKLSQLLGKHFHVFLESANEKCPECNKRSCLFKPRDVLTLQTLRICEEIARNFPRNTGLPEGNIEKIKNIWSSVFSPNFTEIKLRELDYPPSPGPYSFICVQRDPVFSQAPVQTFHITRPRPDGRDLPVVAIGLRNDECLFYRRLRSGESLEDISQVERADMKTYFSDYEKTFEGFFFKEKKRKLNQVFQGKSREQQQEEATPYLRSEKLCAFYNDEMAGNDVSRVDDKRRSNLLRSRQCCAFFDHQRRLLLETAAPKGLPFRVQPPDPLPVDMDETEEPPDMNIYRRMAQEEERVALLQSLQEGERNEEEEDQSENEDDD